MHCEYSKIVCAWFGSIAEREPVSCSSVWCPYHKLHRIDKDSCIQAIEDLAIAMEHISVVPKCHKCKES